MKKNKSQIDNSGNRGITVKKSENFSEWYSQVLDKAEVTDIRLGIKGFIVYRPWAAMSMENMFRLFEQALQSRGHRPTFFPLVIPEGNLKKEASHVKGFTPEVFWLEPLKNADKDEQKLALRPTSETLFTPMFALWIRSHRDLPMKLYQRGSVFRYDTKATRPLIRGREFIWIEAHDAFATQKEAEAQVQEDIKITEEIMHKKFGVPFLAMKRPQWDKFAGAVYTIGSDVLMPDGKIIQQPSTHLLGQQFSKAFGAKFKTESEREDYIWTTAYGPAISRILASVISTHGDDSGLVMPFCIAPTQVVIIPIFKKQNKIKILREANKLKDVLASSNIRTEIDDSEKRPGEKYHEWELKGVPFRLEFGEQEMKKKKLTLFTRDTKKKDAIAVKSLEAKIKTLGQKYDARLKAKADKFMNGKILSCTSKAQIKSAISDGKIARTNFCSTLDAGATCAEKIEKEFTAEVRGTLANKQEKPSSSSKCVICGKKATEVVYIGKSY